MLNLNNHAAELKRNILITLAKLQLEGKLCDNNELEKIPFDLIPDGSVPIRNNLDEDRSIIRIRIGANMGHSIVMNPNLFQITQKPLWTVKVRPGRCLQ